MTFNFFNIIKFWLSKKSFSLFLFASEFYISFVCKFIGFNLRIAKHYLALRFSRKGIRFIATYYPTDFYFSFIRLYSDLFRPIDIYTSIEEDYN